MSSETFEKQWKFAVQCIGKLAGRRFRSHQGVYKQREELRRFQLLREVPAGDGGGPIDIIVDFLMPRHAEIVKIVLRS